MGSKRLSYMSLHFFPFSFFSRLLILARFGQVEDGGTFFVFVITFLPYSSLLSAGQLPIVSFDELEDFFFFTIDRDTERGGSGLFFMFLLFCAASMLQSRGTDYKTGTAFEFGLVRG